MKLSLLAFIATTALAQISQGHPERCGDPLNVQAIPAGLSISIVESKGLLQYDGALIELGGLQREIDQVCALPENRIVVFGSGYGDNINIVDLKQKKVVVSFAAYSAATSPDGRWLAMRAHYPPQSEIQITEMYMVVDLMSRDGTLALVYPRLAKNGSSDRLDFPETLNHSWRSEKFYWSPDSKIVAFGDISAGELDLVTVSVAEGKIEARKYPVKKGDQIWRVETSSDCEDTVAPHEKWIGVEFNGSSWLDVQLHTSGGADRCERARGQLSLSDLQPAETITVERRKMKMSRGISNATRR